jgi:ATP-dependent Clp protease adaptor protein ClpS
MWAPAPRPTPSLTDPVLARRTGGNIYRVLDAFILFVMTLTSMGIVIGWRRRAANKRQIMLTIILQTAMSDVTRRGHGAITPDHLLWTLLDVPEVASAWNVRGWPLVELRDALDARLKPLEGSKPKGVLSPELVGLVRTQARAAARRRGSPWEVGKATFASLVRELLMLEAQAEDSLLAAAPHYPYATFSLDPTTEPPIPACGEGSPSDVPYRHMAVVPSRADVVFWNDPRTTMAAVIEILSQVFNMSELRATYLTLVVHGLGRAVVWSGDRVQAQTLAAGVAEAARAKGMPLRVSVEESDGDAR